MIVISQRFVIHDDTFCIVALTVEKLSLTILFNCFAMTIIQNCTKNNSTLSQKWQGAPVTAQMNRTINSLMWTVAFLEPRYTEHNFLFLFHNRTSNRTTISRYYFFSKNWNKRRCKRERSLHVLLKNSHQAQHAFWATSRVILLITYPTRLLIIHRLYQSSTVRYDLH